MFLKIADYACHRAMVERALQKERVQVVLDYRQCRHHEVLVRIDEEDFVRMFVEETPTHSTIIIEQIGIGMLDGKDSLMLMDSRKRENSEQIFGGQYGIGFKQLLAVLANLGEEDWKFIMLGTVLHDQSGECGWSELSCSTIASQLNVHGKILCGCVYEEVIFNVLLLLLQKCVFSVGEVHICF